MQYLRQQTSRSPIKKLQDDINSLKAEKFWSKFFPAIIAAIIALAALAVAIISATNK